MEILYLDNKIAVCVKPRGALSTDTPGGLPDLLRAALGDREAPVYTVHRLDAPVGGLVVLGRTRHAASDLGKAVQAGRFRKTYRAVVHGTPAESAGTFRDWLVRDRGRRLTRTAGPGEPEAREAVLDYRVLASRTGLSLLEITLRTGRTHQIRCQLSGRGLPLWGDKKYGLPEDAGDIALWSTVLGFPHPVTGTWMEFQKLPPEERPWTAFAGEA